MSIWGQIVDGLAHGLFFLSQAYSGNTGLAIITLSCIVRLAMLPVSIAVQRRAKQQKEILERIQPKIDKINKRYKNNPEKQMQKTLELYKEAGYRPFDFLNILGSLVQLPVVGALYGAIRQGLTAVENSFLWIKNLAQPNPLLAILVAGLTLLSSRLTADSSQPVKLLTLILPAAMTLFFAWRLSAGLGLYWATSTVIGIGQSLYLRQKKSTPI
jgi:YidC/Oxa1 family membrane protein insertase